jgi:type II secretory pathway pseudopilin PulG
VTPLALNDVEFPSKRRSSVAAFTVIELLAVLWIVGVLLAILIPSVSSARFAARKAETRVRFNQWAAAVASFRSEYGYYPVFHGSNRVNGAADTVDHLFFDVLAARKRDGSALTATDAAAVQNPRLIVLHTFAETELCPSDSSTPNLLCDAFGSTDIAVLVDRNLDGVINAADYGSLPDVNGFTPGTAEFPASGIRAGVVFYSAAPGSTDAAPRFILSWKP